MQFFHFPISYKYNMYYWQRKIWIKKQLVALLRQRDKQAWNLLYQNYSEK